MSSPVLNKVRERLLFLSPTVQAGWEPESKKDDFEELKNLGQGAFGVVKRVNHKRTNIAYAIKIVQKSMLKQTNMVEQMVNEVRIMYSLNHPYILKLYNHFEDDVNISLVLEFAPGGQLYQILWKQPNKRFNEKTAAKIILQLALALEHIHVRNIIHRDIKPENILLDEQQNIRLADFGWSNFLKPTEIRNTFCGTLDYLAPEMLDTSHKHDQSVDIWSVGVLCYELLTGLSPFAPKENQNNQKYVEKSTKDNIMSVKFSFTKDFPEGAKDLITKILVKDSKQRYTCEQIRNHPWITEKQKIRRILKYPNKLQWNCKRSRLQRVQRLIVFRKRVNAYSPQRRQINILGQIVYFQNQRLNGQQIIVKEVKVKDYEEEKDNKGNAKQKLLESKLKELDIENIRKQAEIESLRSQIEVLKSSGNVNQDLLSVQNKLKLSDDRYIHMKTKYEMEVQKNSDIQKKMQELEIQNRGSQEDKEQIVSLKAKLKQQKEETETLKKENAQLKLKNGGDTQFLKGPGGNNVDDLLSQLKQKHGQELDQKYK